ncbi:DUF423 domain-containing protein [Mariniluteicoccus flavus]
MSSRTSIITGALLAALGIAFGAFGAHGLKDLVTPERLATFETGVRYQMYAALGLLALGAMGGQRRAPWFLVAGAAVFSGSLYLLVATGIGWLGAITPIGGVLLIVGFALAALDAARRAPERVDAGERSA